MRKDCTCGWSPSWSSWLGTGISLYYWRKKFLLRSLSSLKSLCWHFIAPSFAWWVNFGLKGATRLLIIHLRFLVRCHLSCLHIQNAFHLLFFRCTQVAFTAHTVFLTAVVNTCGQISLDELKNVFVTESYSYRKTCNRRPPVIEGHPSEEVENRPPVCHPLTERSYNLQ